MEWIPAIATVIFLWFVTLFLGSICFFGGIAVSLWLAREYKRDAAEAINEAVSKAYTDHLKELRDQREIKKEFDNSELPTQPQEQQENFEEGLAKLHPNDPELQEQAKKAREIRKLAGR